MKNWEYFVLGMISGLIVAIIVLLVIMEIEI